MLYKFNILVESRCVESEFIGLLQTFFCRDAMPRVFSPIGLNINLSATLGFESGFSGFRGLQRTSLVWV